MSLCYSQLILSDRRRLHQFMERQEQLPPKVRTNSEKNGYTPRGKPGRRKDFLSGSNSHRSAAGCALSSRCREVMRSSGCQS
ncbi:hypothetical protein ABIA23_002538 [Sinorhizobium fredii]